MISLITNCFNFDKTTKKLTNALFFEWFYKCKSLNMIYFLGFWMEAMTIS